MSRPRKSESLDKSAAARGTKPAGRPSASKRGAAAPGRGASATRVREAAALYATDAAGEAGEGSVSTDSTRATDGEVGGVLAAAEAGEAGEDSVSTDSTTATDGGAGSVLAAAEDGEAGEGSVSTDSTATDGGAGRVPAADVYAVAAGSVSTDSQAAAGAARSPAGGPADSAALRAEGQGDAAGAAVPADAGGSGAPRPAAAPADTSTSESGSAAYVPADSAKLAGARGARLAGPVRAAEGADAAPVPADTCAPPVAATPGPADTSAAEAESAGLGRAALATGPADTSAAEAESAGLGRAALAAGPADRPRVGHPPGPLGALDYHLLGEGTHLRLWERMGAIVDPDGEGTHFAVWAPNAQAVSVIGEWNRWDPRRDPLRLTSGGVWTGFAPAAHKGMHYKYRIVGMRGEAFDKADPHALLAEHPPQTASVIWDIERTWHDGAWMAERAARQRPDAPISIYEVHLGSWLRGPGGEHLSYREIAPRLIAHVRRLGFTHVEFLPLTEHPFYGSWGYQASAYFAPTCRYGRPQDLMALIDALHQASIGVILDWVPAHFPADAHGLARFDGTHLYEHADPRRGRHPDWNTLIFNLSRHEVRSFLLSSAMMWLQAYHIDGLRVDAVASMLYLDYSRKAGEWQPNHLGGRENLEAIHFLRELNRAVHREVPGAITIAEESTAWPLVTHPVESGGLGFDFKWDMGWMHDTLRYLGRDPLLRSQHHRDVTFRMMYAYSELFVLPLSHDEVVHGKGSLPLKMSPGTGGLRQRIAGLRLLYAYMAGMPGKKLLFMGDEFGQLREWNHDRALDWHLLGEPLHAGLLRWSALLGNLVRDAPALHELDHDPRGFAWSVVDDNRRSVIAFVRRPRAGAVLLFVLNFTPVPWNQYAIPLPAESAWTLVASSDDPEFGGDGTPAPGRLVAGRIEGGESPCAAIVDLPPTAALVYAGPDVAVYDAAAGALRLALAAEAAAAAAATAESLPAASSAEAAGAPEDMAQQSGPPRGPEATSDGGDDSGVSEL